MFRRESASPASLISFSSVCVRLWCVVVCFRMAKLAPLKLLLIRCHTVERSYIHTCTQQKQYTKHAWSEQDEHRRGRGRRTSTRACTTRLCKSEQRERC